MSEEATPTPEETPETQEELNLDTEVQTDNEVPTPEEAPEVPVEAEPDMVAEAQAANEALKAELEALKNSDTNIFEQNEILKKELEDAKKLAEMAEENKTLQSQLEAIKKNSLLDGMIADGRLNNSLREWADSQSYESLQTFAAKAPKRKTILDEKNDVDTRPSNMLEFKRTQNRSRIM